MKKIASLFTSPPPRVPAAPSLFRFGPFVEQGYQNKYRYHDDYGEKEVIVHLRVKRDYESAT